jgi:hypothetical protein
VFVTWLSGKIPPAVISHCHGQQKRNVGTELLDNSVLTNCLSTCLILQ